MEDVVPAAHHAEFRMAGRVLNVEVTIKYDNNMMKRFLLLFCLLTMAVSHPVSAQISIGGGYLRTLTTAEFGKTSGNGFYAGMTYRIPLAGGSISLVPGLHFTRTREPQGATSSSSFRLDNVFCVENALLATVHMQWGINLSSHVRFFLYAGPSFQYGLHCQAVTGDGNQHWDLYSRNDFGAARQRWSIWAGGGIGLSFPVLSVHRVYLTGGWNYGLMNRYVDSPLKSHSSMWKIGAGFEF